MQNMQGFYTVYTVRTVAIVLEISLAGRQAGIWNWLHLDASTGTPPTWRYYGRIADFSDKLATNCGVSSCNTA